MELLNKLIVPLGSSGNAYTVLIFGIIIVIGLSIAIAFYPYLYPSVIMFIGTIFCVGQLRFQFICFELNFYIISLVLSIFLIICLHRKEIWPIQKLNINWKVFIIFIIFLALSKIIPVIYNQIYFDIFPYYYFRDFALSLSGLLLATIIPSKFIDFKKMMTGFTLCFILALLVLYPGLLEIYNLLNDASTLGRMDSIGVEYKIWSKLSYNIPINVKDQIMHKGMPYIDGASKDYFMILFSGFISFYLFKYLSKNTNFIHFIIFLICYFFIYFFLYANRFGSMTIIFFVLFFTILLYYSTICIAQKHNISKIKIIFLLLLFFLTGFLSFGTERVKNWDWEAIRSSLSFKSDNTTFSDHEESKFRTMLTTWHKSVSGHSVMAEKFKYHTEGYEGRNRYTLCSNRLEKLVKEAPFIGFGIPSEKKIINDVSSYYYSKLTGHSHQLDNYIAFGFIIGILPNIIFIMPIIILIPLIRQKILDYHELLFWLCCFLTTCLSSGLGKFGDFWHQFSWQLFMVTLFIRRICLMIDLKGRNV